MHPLFNRRFFAETCACLFLVGAGFSAGWAVAMDLTSALAEALGIGALLITGSTNHHFVSLKLAFACALPGAVTWLTLLIHRGRAHMRPAGKMLAAVVLLPWLVGLVAAGARLAWVAQTLRTSGTYEVEPLVAMSTLAPGGWASRAILLAGLVMWAMTYRLAAPLSSTASD